MKHKTTLLSTLDNKPDFLTVPADDDDDQFGYEKVDRYNMDQVGLISAGYRTILTEIGENPEREGLLKTPERAAKAMQYLTQGYDLDAEAILRSAMFKEEYSQSFLHLQTTGKNIDNAWNLTQANNMSVGNIGNMCLTKERQ